MEDKNIPELLQKYKAGDCTAEEKAWLESWYVRHDFGDIPELPLHEIAKDLQHISERLPLYQSPKTRQLWPRIVAAASILIILSFGTYFVIHQSAVPVQTAHNRAKDIAPGSDKAIITLANGQKIALTGAKPGLLASQGNTSIHLRTGGQVIYQTAGRPVDLQYNTMTTPRGGQHALTLSDGTRVWLDAASSITYPVAFTGRDRIVNITGQVYFEVAHDASKPFKVMAREQTVEVLGTHFNINAYSDEPNIKTTLFEGTVKISSNIAHAFLKPGQQAQFNQDKINVVNDANMDEAIAWHRGLFEFHDADIQTVMRQLSRWYDVDISYEGKIPDRRFSGKLYRNVTALTIADLLSYKKIHFRIDGKQIIVEP